LGRKQEINLCNGARADRARSQERRAFIQTHLDCTLDLRYAVYIAVRLHCRGDVLSKEIASRKCARAGNVTDQQEYNARARVIMRHLPARLAKGLNDNGSVLTIELDIAVRLAEGVFRYAFVAAIIGHRDRTYHELHVHLVHVVREGWLVLVPCNFTSNTMKMSREMALSLSLFLIFKIFISKIFR